MLVPGQFSTLTEMGIPVWELRTAENDTLVSDVANTDHYEALPAVDCLIVLAEQDNHDDAKRLLQAMLFSIGLTQNNSAIVRPNQLHQLSEIANSLTQHQLLIAFGDDLVPKTLSSQTLVRGQVYSANDSAIRMIISLSLTTLLNSPDKKALAWQDLQLLKASYQQDVTT